MSPTSTSHPPPARPSPIRVALVEDDAGFAGNLAGSLQQANDLSLVAVVASRDQALAVLADVRHVYDKLKLTARLLAQ